MTKLGAKPRTRKFLMKLISMEEIPSTKTQFYDTEKFISYLRFFPNICIFLIKTSSSRAGSILMVMSTDNSCIPNLIFPSKI